MAAQGSGAEHEQHILQTFCENIGNFNFDKAKEILEREQAQVPRGEAGALWAQVLSTLTTVLTYEKQYISLQFLQQKGFFRREPTARTQHLTLESEFTHLAKKYGAFSSDPSATVMQHLCDQLFEYCRSRTNTVEFLEAVAACNQMRIIPFEELAKQINDVIVDYDKKFHHPAILGLRTTVHHETKIFYHLIHAQLEISACQYLTSLMHIHEASVRLADWSANMPVKEGLLKSMFGGSSKPGPPALVVWLNKLKKLLLAKFGLYFHETLEQFSPPGSLPPALSKLPTDFCAKMTHFQRKCDASALGLMLDTSTCTRPFTGLGYSESSTDTLTGCQNYPLIYCSHGKELLLQRQGELIMLVSSRKRDLVPGDKIVHSWDKSLCRTYFLAAVESGIVLVLMFDGKKAEKDSAVSGFISETVQTLRAVKLFQNFKASVK